MNGTLNKVILIGHLGDDVKIHYFENGNCIGRFPLATNEVYINKTTNEKITSTEWHNIVVRNKAAEVCEKYLSKGDRIYIEGRIRTRQWTSDDGTSKQTVEIMATEFTFLDVKRNADHKDNQSAFDQQKKEDVNNFVIPKENNDDDLPF
ncbi:MULTISPECIES: single-stranded DNA-binding protein [Myroides]|uniref:Single-stranded DNA-binding protein n=1 Tax=Myroides albus TaxID=2562892 RepID=A0A6I3LI92_9FLAO|nr:MULTISPECIES: single-stranded DNA-binding protein [Myroides]MTG96880.1 single-stranded DNA-binding protein [Myroides albus]MVX36496.1 single-stranded DNA-binding protein [Myroides sp. LoEW2-1]UVD78370.1 single-stranded DNA-binding protein [Myroides albus]